MHVAMQLKVPIEDATRVLDRLTSLRAKHARQVKEAPAARREELIVRGKRLLPNNLMRIVIAAGVEAMVKVKDEDLLALLAEDVIVRGRPRGR